MFSKHISYNCAIVIYNKYPELCKVLMMQLQLYLNRSASLIICLQVTADLTPLSPSKVAVKFDYFKILGLVSHEYDESMLAITWNEKSSSLN